MTEWTSEARQERDAFLARQREALSGEDINPDEVIEDLRRHIDEELKAIKLVTREDVQRAIKPLEPWKAPDSPRPPEKTNRPGAALIVFGIVMPLISLIVELTVHICAGFFFDPIPTWWHVLLAALVPGVNFLIIQQVRSGKIDQSTWLLTANSAAIVIAICYSIAFAPLCVPGLIAVFYFGFGLLPMGPLFGLIASFFCRRHLIRHLGKPFSWRSRPSLVGVVIAIVSLSALELQDLTTRIALEWADDENAEKQARGIHALRSIGSEHIMLRACYERPRKFTNLAAMIISPENPVSQSDARTIFFRVTGRPFNAQRPPRLYTRQGRWQELDELTWEWDRERGGDAVAGRVRGLFLHGSRMDCRVHSQAGVAYLEWTFEFVNQSRRQREARTQILLPPGGVVSRLTLWVNGEEREAAFAGRAHVREAYENIVRQRRDPVLVTTTGQDRILMQCFPVPPDGGTMKTRVGITIPLHMLNVANGRLILPHMQERNFNLSPDLEHAIWIESRSELGSPLISLTQGSKDDEEFTLFGQLIDQELNSGQAVVEISRPEPVTTVWSPNLTEQQIVVQRLEQTKPLQPDRLVLVVDGSIGMTPYYPEIASALESLPSDLEVFWLHASDEGQHQQSRTAGQSPSSTGEIESALNSLGATGGQDNLRWLVRAWDLAAAADNGIVLWVHGPQPVRLNSDQAFKQRLERSPRHPQVFELQTRVGPNRLLEDLGQVNLGRIVRTGDLRADLERWFTTLASNEGEWQFLREARSASEQSELNDAPKVTPHIRRLWAAEQIQQLAQRRENDFAIQMAQHHQLVTSVSGAVVLETKQQFENAGLTPVDANTVPMIPEPCTVLLWVLGLSVLFGPRLFPRKQVQS